METTEILKEIRKMSDNNDRIKRVKRFIEEDPKFKEPFTGDVLLRAIPECLLYLLETPGKLDEFTLARYYSSGKQPVNEETFYYFASEINKLRQY